MKDVHLLYRAIKKWADESFGPERDKEMILDHLDEELSELRRAIESYDKGWSKIDEVAIEMADVQILLFNLMSRMGVCVNTYFDWVAIKHKVNADREWELRDGKMKHKEKCQCKNTIAIKGDIQHSGFCPECGDVV